MARQRGKENGGCSKEKDRIKCAPGLSLEILPPSGGDCVGNLPYEDHILKHFDRARQAAGAAPLRPAGNLPRVGATAGLVVRAAGRIAGRAERWERHRSRRRTRARCGGWRGGWGDRESTRPKSSHACATCTPDSARDTKK